MIGKLFKALQRSRSGIADTIRSVLGKRPSAEEVENLEDVLLQSDMGYDVVQDILEVVDSSSGSDLMDAVRDALIKSCLLYTSPSPRDS